MRIFIILAFIVLSSYQNDSNHDDSYFSHVLQRREATTTAKPKTTTAKPTTKATTTVKPTTTTTKKPPFPIGLPDIKTSLTTASQVFTTLGDIKNAQKFAERYLEIKPVRLIGALKGLSIAASLMFAFIDIPDPETEKILNNMNKNFDKMFNKMDSQTAELKSYIDQKFLNNFVLAPVKTAVDGMYVYRNKTNAANKAAFLEKAKSAKLPEVINRILLDARDILTNIMINSRYNDTKVKAMSTVLVHNCHKAFLVEAFRNGLELKGQMLVDRIDTHNEFFRKTFKEYKTISDEVFNELQTSFFPGFIEEDILKPVIDANEGDHCKKAETILNKLTTNFPWRQYAVIVSEEKRGSMSCAHYGVPNRSLATDSYNGKAVKIFMATKSFDKNKKAYLDSNERNAIITEAAKWWIFNLDKMVNFAGTGNKTYQMAVYTDQPKQCVRFSNAGAVDEFKSYAEVPDIQENVYSEVNFIVVL